MLKYLQIDLPDFHHTSLSLTRDLELDKLRLVCERTQSYNPLPKAIDSMILITNAPPHS